MTDPKARIAITLRGGLGNQLFQWALACQLRTSGAVVHLDPSCLREVSFELSGLAEKPRMRHAFFRRTQLLGRLHLPPKLLGWQVAEEPAFHFQSQIIAEPQSRLILHGYWQTARYWPDVEETVASRVRAWARGYLTAVGRSLARELETVPSGIIHVRRGDYGSPKARLLHGLLAADYFLTERDAARRRGIQKFYVFSNDLAWCEQHLAAPDTAFVGREVATGPAGDVALMSLGADHILSNSSFSWWGAWLAQRDGSVVLPRLWFLDPTMDTSDLIPAHWVRSEFAPT